MKRVLIAVLVLVGLSNAWAGGVKLSGTAPFSGQYDSLTVTAITNASLQNLEVLSNGFNSIGVAGYSYFTPRLTKAFPVGFNDKVIVIKGFESNMYYGGKFTAVDGSNIYCIVRRTSGAWYPMGAGLNNWVRGLAIGTDGVVYATGKFTASGALPLSYVAKWNGLIWTNLNTGFQGNAALDSDNISCVIGKSNILYVGGNGITNAGGISATRMAAWNGTYWTNMGAGVDGGVYCMAIDQNDTVYAGGSFANAGGVACAKIAKWQNGYWTNLSTGADGDINCMNIDLDGNLYIVGAFNTVGGVSCSKVAKWNGTYWTNLSTGCGASIYTSFIDKYNALHVFGTFTNAGGVMVTNAATWNGSTWASYGLSAGGGDIQTSDISGSTFAIGGYNTNAQGQLSMYAAEYQFAPTFENNVMLYSPLAVSPTPQVGSKYFGTDLKWYECTNILTGWVAE